MRAQLLTAAAIGCLSLAACSDSNPGPASNTLVSPRLDSGVTSSNGGGQRTLGDQPGIGIGTSGTTSGQSPNGKGNAY